MYVIWHGAGAVRGLGMWDWMEVAIVGCCE